jgi:hypothetical protein
MSSRLFIKTDQEVRNWFRIHTPLQDPGSLRQGDNLKGSDAESIGSPLEQMVHESKDLENNFNVQKCFFDFQKKKKIVINKTVFNFNFN